VIRRSPEKGSEAIALLNAEINFLIKSIPLIIQNGIEKKEIGKH